MKLSKPQRTSQDPSFKVLFSNEHCIVLIVLALLVGCGVPNNPYPKPEHDQEIYYNTFSEEPKHFDPAISYSSDEYRFIQQIYEPPLQYH